LSEILTITNRRLGDGAFESSSHSGIDTFALSPASVTDTLEALVLVTLEGLGSLLDDLSSLVHGKQLCHCKLRGLSERRDKHSILIGVVLLSVAVSRAFILLHFSTASSS
jgi:hypothetical protein